MGESILGFLAGLVAVAFVLALLATFIVAVVLAVFRFRKNPVSYTQLDAYKRQL